MKDFARLVPAGAGLVGLLGLVLASAAHAEGDISGVWWATTYSPKIVVVGGDDPPLNAAGKAQYATNQAGLKNGLIVDKARKVCSPDGVPRLLETPYPFEIFQVPKGQVTMIHELNHQLRVIALDKPMRKYEDLALFENYNGYSVGHWEGDTVIRWSRPSASAGSAVRSKMSSPSTIRECTPGTGRRGSSTTSAMTSASRI